MGLSSQSRYLSQFLTLVTWVFKVGVETKKKISAAPPQAPLALLSFFVRIRFDASKLPVHIAPFLGKNPFLSVHIDLHYYKYTARYTLFPGSTLHTEWVTQKSDPTQSVIEKYVGGLLKCFKRCSVAKSLPYIMCIFLIFYGTLNSPD